MKSTIRVLLVAAGLFFAAASFEQKRQTLTAEDLIRLGRAARQEALEQIEADIRIDSSVAGRIPTFSRAAGGGYELQPRKSVREPALVVPEPPTGFEWVDRCAGWVRQTGGELPEVELAVDVHRQQRAATADARASADRALDQLLTRVLVGTTKPRWICALDVELNLWARAPLPVRPDVSMYQRGGLLIHASASKPKD